MTYAIVRIRGTVDVNEKISSTMEMLNVAHPNHCSVVPKDDSFKGMLQKAKDYVTYGELNAGTLTRLLQERGRLEGDAPVTDETVSESTEFDDVQDFAEAVIRGDAHLKEIPGLKKTFRLHPPRGGYKGTKRHLSVGGSLGYRGNEINDLIDRMM